MAPGLAKLKVEKRIAQAAEEPVPVAKTGALTAKDPWISKNATYRVSSVHFIFRPLPGLLTGAEGDGNLHNTDQFAFHTEEEKTPFIVIDLQKEYRITGIVILNRRDATARAAGLKVWLSTDPSSRGREVWHAEEVAAKWQVPVKSVRARYVTLGLINDTPTALHLAHVFVYGH